MPAQGFLEPLANNMSQPSPPSMALQRGHPGLPAGAPDQVSEQRFAFVPYTTEQQVDGTTMVRLTGEPISITNPDSLAVVQHGFHDGSVAQRAVPGGPALAITTHVPLGPGDAPNAPGSDHRRRFRLLVESVNELERLRPDLAMATEKGWVGHIEKLSRKMRHLEKDITHRLAKWSRTDTFVQLIPTYPQLWKYLDPLRRQALTGPQGYSAPSRMIQDAALIKEEDNKSNVLTSANNRYRDARPGFHAGSSSSRPVVKDEYGVKQEYGGARVNPTRPARRQASPIVIELDSDGEVVEPQDDHRDRDRSISPPSRFRSAWEGRLRSPKRRS